MSVVYNTGVCIDIPVAVCRMKAGGILQNTHTFNYHYCRKWKTPGKTYSANSPSSTVGPHYEPFALAPWCFFWYEQSHGIVHYTCPDI
jgi:hypothetical protein